MTNKSIITIIVDDETRGIVALQRMIEKYCPDLQVVGTATNIAIAAELIRSLKPELVFLDIEMPEGNGFQLLEQFSDPEFKVVFVTAYEEYAIKAIKTAALDYLLKPVKLDELQDTIQRFINRRYEKVNVQYESLMSALSQGRQTDKIILSAAEGYYPVKIDDIIYCKADDSYTHFYLQNNKHHIVSRSLKEFETILDAHGFCRIHKSYLININHIERILKSDGGSVVMSNSEVLPISFRKKDEFFLRLKTI